ncbi:MAG TPA: type I methionyl aminopeptidase [Thermomicrobiales bacterium]|nr:type I methionyl aminopeptidase [Thermomicrobiales bacterium]
MVIVRRTEQLEGLQRANRETTRMLRYLQTVAQPGVTTKVLDDAARAFIAELGGEPVFATQAGFPGAINANPNDVVVHGVPGKYVLQKGDIFTIDGGMLLDGYVGDAAITFPVGPMTPRHQALIDTTWGAMQAAIAAAKTGAHVGDVSWAMQSYAEEHGCNVVRDFCGHGLGTRMWEDPQVPFAGNPKTGERLLEGMVITVEPVVMEGQMDYYMANQWEARSVDGKWVAQFERAVMVTKSGGVILSGD